MKESFRDGLFPGWLLWIIGPVTVLAAALIIFSVVLGIQAGQRQIEFQRRQQVGIHLQRAVDYTAESRLQEALAEYQQALALDPGNAIAQEGQRVLLEMAATGLQPQAAPSATGPSATGPSAIVPQPNPGQTPQPQVGAAAPTSGASSGPGAVLASTVTPNAGPQEQLWQQALSLYQGGRWLDAADLLEQLSESAPQFRPDQVKEILFNCYVNLAAERDQEGDLEEALAYVDQALAIRPDSAELRMARTLVANYLEAIRLSDTRKDEAIALLEGIYAQNPGYRDVATRLHRLLLAYGDELVIVQDWCGAAEHYTAAIEIEIAPGSIARRDQLQAQCDVVADHFATATATASGIQPPTAIPQSTVAVALATTATPESATDAGTDLDAVAPDETPTPEPVAAAQPATAPASGPATGRILFSAADINTGATNTYIQPVSGGPASLLVAHAQHAAFRPDMQRVVYRNLRDDMRGITSLDPATELVLRFTEFAEDSFPSWNGEGNRIAFASNREGDRRWRIYVAWADVNGATQGMGFGNSPAWSPAADRIAYNGCDDTGNGCGIRLMSGSGGDHSGLTSTPDDDRPAWAPNGSFVVFMSTSRAGNSEVYRVDVGSGSVTRLTNDPAIDGLPTVSPDGQWVAYLSNRGGAWAIWAVPASGGTAQQIAPIDGVINAWQDQSLQWIP